MQSRSDTLPKTEDPPKRDFWRYLRSHLNFYRIHIIVFTFTPIIFSVILYGSNGKYPISYIDALFNSISAMAVCGLATVDLSQLTTWQQALIFIQMCLGSPVLVSWVMVYIRRYFFAKSFEHMLEAEAAKHAEVKIDVEAAVVPWHSKMVNMLRRRKRLTTVRENSTESAQKERTKPGSVKKLRPDMIRRMDDAPKLVDPSGWISEGLTESTVPSSNDGRVDTRDVQGQKQNHQLSFADQLPPSPGQDSVMSSDSSEHDGDITETESLKGQSRRGRRLSDPGMAGRFRSGSVSATESHFRRFPTVNVAAYTTREASPLPRTQTVEFAPDPRRQRETREKGRRGSVISEQSIGQRRPSIDPYIPEERRPGRRPSVALRPTMSAHTIHAPTYLNGVRTKHRGFGGFPMPHEILSRMFRYFFPQVQQKLQRTMTMPMTTTIASQRGEVPAGVKPVPYISFDAIVGRNSAFYELTNEQLEELGGVEYRALNALLWIVALYHILVQGICFIIIGPYMSESRWSSDFKTPALHRDLPPPWFALFQVVSTYTNTGMSLVDQSMIPFQTAYPMIVFMIFLILAGNTAFPIFLRLTIWTMTKLVPVESRLNETLHFLLDHPRRCFIYLFPSHQTWFLLIVLLGLTCTDWVSFLVLDIGTPEIQAVPVGTRVIVGLLQATAVRAAGFSAVALSALAPAVKVLYVIMMYVSVYPIAMSVRSTNVYEEQSLGVFEDDDESENDIDFQASGPRVAVWSRYLAWHARKQLAFDMWWLGLALVLLCIIEVWDDVP
ncbi:TrkH-domain-containing protein [Heliocybe sulcata]|uniref:TrkH-domain-containing protein n=1 Tax=Heliocybe sulcata TaxID=5364 RepID=A0A5C3N048_9AGAM|nr:TrkH-domain-containing protein [Heliocybe sulcata]